MLRKSFNEESDFQEKLNFAKHKSTAKKKLQQAKQGGSLGHDGVALTKQFNLGSDMMMSTNGLGGDVYANNHGKNNKGQQYQLKGAHKASIVS